jgi:cytoskeletal protein RodZ
VSLEAEHWPKLPASVYVRGFLGEYSRILGLDGRRVVETYLERYRAARGATVNEELEDKK